MQFDILEACHKEMYNISLLSQMYQSADLRKTCPLYDKFNNARIVIFQYLHILSNSRESNYIIIYFKNFKLFIYQSNIDLLEFQSSRFTLAGKQS